jgi:hypothetical protein
VLGVADILWLKGLLTYLKLDQGTQMKLLCDSQSAINIANNLVQHDRTKEKLDNRLLELSHVATVK